MVYIKLDSVAEIPLSRPAQTVVVEGILRAAERSLTDIVGAIEGPASTYAEAISGFIDCAALLGFYPAVLAETIATSMALQWPADLASKITSAVHAETLRRIKETRS